MVIAINKKGQKQQFSDLAWRKLGKNTNGWTLVGEQKTENTVQAKVKTSKALPTGEAQTTANTVDPNKEGQKVENVLEPTVENTSEENTTSVVISDEQKSEFLESVKGLNRAAIKELLESPAVNVEYDKRATLPELQEILGAALGYDIEKFQKILE